MLNTTIKPLKVFDLSLLLMERLMTISAPPVLTGQIFDAPNVFHPDGLFSTKIFGETGGKERFTLNGHIELNLEILHPLVYLGITSMSSLFKDIIHGEKKAIWDDVEKTFKEDENGQTGYLFFKSKMMDIIYTNPIDSDLREFKIKLVDIKDEKLLTMDKLFVTAAGFRDYTIDSNGRPSQDEVNDFYRSVINSAGMLDGMSVDNEYNPFIDSIRMKIQQNALNIYLYLLNALDGKRGVLQSNVISRDIKYGTRNVITADASVINRLGSGNHLRFNEMSVGLYQHSKAIAPIAIARLRDMFSKVVSQHEKTITVINKKTLETNKISVPNKIIDEFTTDKGLNGYLNKFSDSTFAKKDVGGDEYSIFMISENNGIIKLIDTTEYLNEEEKKYIRPITNIELLYLTICNTFDKYYASSTRYPAINQGSTFPVKPNIKPTLSMKSVEIESMDGVMLKVDNYPDLTADIYDSISPHHTKLARATADSIRVL